MKTAPQTYKGKKKVFEEIFKSVDFYTTEKQAYGVLDSIRQTHSASLGWVEFDSSVQEVSDGKWQAIRHHAKYE